MSACECYMNEKLVDKLALPRMSTSLLFLRDKNVNYLHQIFIMGLYGLHRRFKYGGAWNGRNDKNHVLVIFDDEFDFGISGVLSVK